MNENLKLASSYVYRAVSDMQARINDVRQSEYRERQEEGREEGRISDDLHQDEARLTMNAANTDKDQREVAQEDAKLIKHDYDLHHHRDEIKGKLDQKTAEHEREINSLQQQINKLNEIGRVLDNWRN